MGDNGRRGGPIHVLHYAWAISEGGAANGIVNLCNGLDPERYRSSIISLTYLGGLGKRLDTERTSVYRMRNHPEGSMSCAVTTMASPAYRTLHSMTAPTFSSAAIWGIDGGASAYCKTEVLAMTFRFRSLTS